jgi:hypothetical protein
MMINFCCYVDAPYTLLEEAHTTRRTPARRAVSSTARGSRERWRCPSRADPHRLEHGAMGDFMEDHICSANCSVRVLR